MKPRIISNILIIDMYNIPSLEEVKKLVDNYKITNPLEYNKSIDNAMKYLFNLPDYES